MDARFSIAATGSLSFGAGVFDDLASHLAKLGYHTVALVASKTFLQGSRCSAFLQQCKDCEVSVLTYPVSGEPSVGSIDELSHSCLSDGCDVVVGVGGGSALDSAKAVAVMAKYLARTTERISVKRFLEGVGDLTPPPGRLPLFAVPTTAGTGSEATKNAVIAQVGPNGFKKSLRHDSYIPDLVVVDPSLAITVPQTVTAASALDALTQLLEAYVSVKSNTFIDSLALEAIALVGNALPKLLEGNLDDLDARSDMAYAAYISGVAIANAGLGYVHGFAGPIGGLHSIPHGVICGNLIVPIHKAMVLAAKEHGQDSSFLQKLTKIAALWHVDGPEGVIEHMAQMVRLAKLPPLRDYGFTKEELVAIGSKDASRNSPVKLTQEQTISLLEALL
ncbi:iron-containing alcohol dehydrogenase [Pleomorphochaeta sp. DL1XJH-081]|uniref:iron-containing alcohol dehydrogenase n=1 Tax=Pleomorphochaeta sp. DL1XJH-081 TaxID=3409690 RepID=UPI003BB8100A